MRVSGANKVDFQIAGRFGSYRSVGGFTVVEPFDPSTRPRSGFDSFDPTVGIRFEPLKGFAFRASYGTGFLPPALNQLRVIPPTLSPNNNGLRDPKRGNELLGSYFSRGGGSPDLQPEQSTSKSFGVILTPPVDNLRLSFDWTRISKRDNIATVVLSQSTIDQEDFLEDVIVRNTDSSTFGPFGVGPIVEIDRSLRNATRAFSESYDIAASYLLDANDHGAFELYANATRLVHNELQVFPAQPSTENAAFFSSPSWQANASLTWTWRSLSATWSGRYLDEVWVKMDHTFSAAQGADRLPAETYHDIALQYRFDSSTMLPAMFSGGNVQIGIKNVFDTKPRYFGEFGTIVYDPWASPMLATYYVAVSARF
jgi:outer membrane receptor protein involved in Fe transport